MIVPRVYSFAPGVLNGAAFVNGVNRVLISHNPHYWKAINFVNNVEVTAENINTGQRVRYVAQAANVQVFYAPDGVNYSPGSLMVGAGLTLTSTDYRVSTSIAYIVELEDAITVFGVVPNPGGLSLPNALSASVQAGRVFSPLNRSDDTMSHGIMSGYAGIYGAVTTFMWLNNDTTVSTPSQSYVQTRSGWVLVCCPNTSNRHKRVASQVPMIENIGDDADIERLVPFPVTGPVSGTLSGHFGFTRYIRARKYGWGDTVNGFQIDNFTVANSDTDPNIAWKHSYFVNFATVTATVINVVHIWQQAPVQHIT
jgi:hypothetical protein